MKDIVSTLKLMCDEDNPQDQKLLLLAELVDSKCDILSSNQQTLKESLDKTSEKLDKLTELLEANTQETKSCPVYQNKEGFEKLATLVKYPKWAILTVIGLISILLGYFGSEVFDVIKFLVK